jgi:hypothetical protein
VDTHSPTKGTLVAETMSDVEFFEKHAGFNIAPGETEAEGRRRAAVALASAEQWARDAGYVVAWEDDDDGDHSYTEQDEFEGYEVTTCEFAYLYDPENPEGGPLAALGCIDDATDEYRRVVAAELAAEVRADIETAAARKAAADAERDAWVLAWVMA